MADLHLARKIKVISASGSEEYTLSYLEMNRVDKENPYRIFPFDRERQDALYHESTLLLDLTGSDPLLKEI